ncbi:MAG: TonB-dependent receptor [Zoogloea sp.]|nr:TonB-dependent receptor [Zoogloea sp.]
MNAPFRPLPLLGAMLAAFGVPAAVHAADAADDAVRTETVSVFGKGQTRQVQGLDRDDIKDAAPGTSPLKVLEKLPGVNFQSSDAFGAYEWSTRITVRGFNQNQLGFTLDDVPLGDMSYGNHNGLHISRAISSENVGRVTLSQGTGALDTASSSNLGGTVQFYSVDPSDKAGVAFAQTVGDYDTRRSFVRFDSGRLDSGTKVSISYTKQDSDKWRGEGEQRQEQVNAKLVNIFGENRLSAFVNYSMRREIDYQDMSKEMINRLGYKWDNYYPDWTAARQAAAGIFSHGETSMDDAYYAGSGIRRDWLSGVSLDAKIAEAVRLKTTVYHHEDHGAGLWYTPYVASSATVPISLRTTEYDIDRSGILSAITAQAGIHKLNAGVWYERNVFDQARRFYALGFNDPGRSPYDLPSDPMATQWDYSFKTDTLQFHIQDTMRLSERLTLNAGFKSLSASTSVDTRTGISFPGEIKASKPFLPQLGVNYALSESDELFASVARNMRTFQAAATGTSPFATTAAGFAAIRDDLKPETSINLEAGWRHRQEGFETLLTAYHVDFRDRLLAIQQGAGIVGNPVVLANVGRVVTNGVEGGLSWSPARNVTWFNSVSFNDSKYKDDFLDNGTLVQVSGKEVVDAPKFMLKSELGYDNGVLFGRIGAVHLSKRYYTYTNDNWVDGYTLWNLGAGYRLGNMAFVRDLAVQLNVTNLFNKEYISTIGSNGFTNSDPSGTAQTLLTGAPRAVFVTVGGKF